MKPYQIIVNPVSGRGAGAQSISAVEAGLHSRGIAYQLIVTERPGHGIELARQAARGGYSVVVAVGGDGTANEIINGLMAAKLAGEGESALGVICVGRGNDFAYGARIPVELNAALDTLKANHRQLIDIGQVHGGLYPNGRFFGNGVGID